MIQSLQECVREYHPSADVSVDVTGDIVEYYIHIPVKSHIHSRMYVSLFSDIIGIKLYLHDVICDRNFINIILRHANE